MHRCLFDNIPDGMEVDHINGNTLDCRRENLRIVTSRQNTMNIHIIRGKSCYKGVFWNKDIEKWYSRIGVNYKLINLGYFASEIEAAKAYDRAALKHFGEFARLNFG